MPSILRSTRLKLWQQIEMLEDRRMLATYVVNSELDNIIPDDGLVTLREAIIAVNESNHHHDESTRIVFDNAIDGKPIKLTIPGTREDAARTGDLDIRNNVTIIGNGPEQTVIDANSLDRIFDFDIFGSATLMDLSLTGGKVDGSGGAIRARNSGLTIERTTISENSAGERGGGVFSDRGVLSISQSHISHNQAGGRGGGIFINGLPTISQSVISDNVAEQGTGGIYSTGDVSIHQTTISRNSAGERIFIWYLTGGVSARGDILITDSTISHNEAHRFGSGGVNAAGDVIVESSTFAFNAGTAVSASGKTTISNSTIADNYGVHGSGTDGVHSPIVELKNSIVAGNGFGRGDDILTNELIAENSFIGWVRGWRPPDERQSPDENGNRYGSDPRLGPLQDNGGPTLTRAPLPGSPVIDTGIIVDGIEFDQRGDGFSRSVGVAPEMGAVELQSLPVIGDSNLDGRFDSSDLIALFQAGEFEDDISNNSVWEDGDWNGDGEFDSSDLVLAFQTGNYIFAARPLTVSVDQLFHELDKPLASPDTQLDGFDLTANENEPFANIKTAS